MKSPLPFPDSSSRFALGQRRPAPDVPNPAPHRRRTAPPHGARSPADATDTHRASRIAARLAIDAEVRRQHTGICARVDRRFAWLMLVQWVAAIVIALWISPAIWAGDASYLHPGLFHSHVAMAILYGGVLTLVPVAMTRIASGKPITRLTVAILQMLMSSLLIHLTGGRIETHFHIFGSLALLAFYMDWQVLVVASATIAIDHYLRGVYLPFSIFGAHTLQPWRWLEHTGWVVFCDIFLILSCADRLRSLRELTARHIEHEELLHHALYDTLTGLPNRSFLSEKIISAIRDFTAHEAAASSANPANPPTTLSPAPIPNGFCCLYIDLDRFKEINDHMGHLCGDALLLQVAGRIQSRLDEDAFLARIGGDEFVVLVPQSPVPQSPVPQRPSQPHRAEELARAILRSLLQPFEAHGREIILGASIGISRYPQDGLDEAELLMKSDRAMYHVKRAGRNNYLVHSAAMLDQESERAEAERNLHRAIERRELQVHYQPIFHSDRSIAGLEALVRWVDPIRGNIPPSHFIPLAEETGLIIQLGNYVLHEACRQATDWHSRGLLTGRIAVNVSSLELAREDFAEAVILTLRQHYTPPEAIELEVTETTLLQDFVLAERHLRQLHRFGIRISIDDFGTGYSSLGRLRQLTLDTLKVDRIFVDGVDTAGPDQTVVGHIIAMAHTLGLKVVAEGVETDSQLQALRSLECDQLQGFYLSRPLDKDHAESLLIQIAGPNLNQEDPLYGISEAPMPST